MYGTQNISHALKCQFPPIVVSLQMRNGLYPIHNLGVKLMMPHVCQKGVRLSLT